MKTRLDLSKYPTIVLLKVHLTGAHAKSTTLASATSRTFLAVYEMDCVRIMRSLVHPMLQVDGEHTRTTHLQRERQPYPQRER